MLRINLFLVVIMGLAFSVSAQTCCTGGTPLLGSYVFSNSSTGNWTIHSTFNHNYNNDLISGDKELDDSFVSRRVNSVIAQLDYGISPVFTISVVAPYLMQQETIFQQSRSATFNNNGIGDFSVWGRYQIQKETFDLGIAAGLKVPTGHTNEEDRNGVALPLSMQSGSGSYDIGFNVQSTYYLRDDRKLAISNQLAFKLNSKGRNFEAHPNYRFGNQYQALSTISYQYIVHSFVSRLFGGAIYQYRLMDKFEGGFINENTGGHWLNLMVGQSTGINPYLDVGLNFLLPIYRNLNGLQLSTTWQGSITVSYKIFRGDDTITFDSM